jgi:cytochrome bd-type quinol oxidase subunit 2
MGLSAQLLSRANEALDHAQGRYRLGLSSIVELIQAQFPYLIEQDITIYNAAAPPGTLRLLLAASAAGALLLFPSFYCLFRVFKGRSA